MKILAIDTSAKAASACIAQEDKIIGEFFINTSLTHSQTLMPMIEQLSINAQVPLGEIEAIAVNAGPGSFTGVRIGVAAAKGLAFADNLPCVSVSTLESMAYNALGADCIVCAVMDARCSQVYNALFRVKDGKIERLCDDRALVLSDLEQELKAFYGEKIMLIGDGAEISFEYLKNSLPDVILAPSNIQIQKASSTALAAFKRISEGDVLTDEKLMPAYLRLPQAQRELNKRMGVTKCHGGFNLICAIKKYLDEKGIEYKEFGTFSDDSVDYPIYAYKVAKAVTEGDCELGILCCGTGIGISMAANKVKGVRAAVVNNEFGAEMTRRHNHANILCMGGRVTSEEDAVKFTDIFLNTPEEGGRHDNRVAMLKQIEDGTFSV